MFGGERMRSFHVLGYKRTTPCGHIVASDLFFSSGLFFSGIKF